MGVRDRLKKYFNYETRVVLIALSSGLLGVGGTLFLLWRGGFSLKVQLTAGAVVVVWWLLISFAQREQMIRPLQTLSNLPARMRRRHRG